MSIALIDIHANSFITISEYEAAYDAGLMQYTITSLDNSILTFLPDNLFKNCDKLEYINLTNVQQIGSSVFYGCDNLKKLYLNKLSVIDKPRQFANLSSLSDIIVDNAEILSTATEAFLNCSSLKNIQLKCNSLIPQSAFKNCCSLNDIIIKTDSENTYNIGSSAFEGCSSLEEFNFVNCKQIFERAFSNCINLKELYLMSVSNIDYYAFANCSNLEYISFGSKLSSIGAAAFKNCSKLKYIEIPSNISWAIGNYAFESCSELNFVSIDGNPEIGWRAFSGCFNIKSIYAPNLKSISSIMIPKSYYLPVVETLGTDIYYNSSHTIIDISTIEKVSINAFVMWRNDPIGPSDTLELHLSNCTTYAEAFGNFLTKIEMEKLTHINSSSYYFAGYRGYGPAAVTYYSNLKLSHVYMPEFIMTASQKAFDFPTRSASNQGIASCIEVFGCNNTESIFYYSYLNSSPLCSKLNKIFINTFSTSRAWQLFEIAPNLSEIELITDSSRSFTSFWYIPEFSSIQNGHYNIVANYSGSIDIRTMWLQYELSFSNITEIHTGVAIYNNAYSDAAMICSNYSITSFECQTLKSIINRSPNYYIWQSRLYVAAAIFSKCSSLSIISLPSLEQLSQIALATDCPNLNKVYLPKLSELSIQFLMSCGFINDVNLELCVNDYKNIESSFNTLREYEKIGQYTEFSNFIYGTYECNEFINTEKLILPNCIKINHYIPSSSFYYEYHDTDRLRSIYSKGTRHLIASNCSYIVYYDVRSNAGLLDIQLSSYVDYFSFHNCGQLSILSLKTSSTYILQNKCLYNMYSLKNLTLEASESIIFSSDCVYKASSVASHSSVYDVELMNISNMNFKANDVYINYKFMNYIYYNTGGGAYGSSIISTYFMGDIINISANNLIIDNSTGLIGKQLISINTNTLSVTSFDRLFSPLIILDTPVYVSGSGSIRTNLYYNQHYVFESSIFRVVKVRPSLLSLYKNDEYYMSNESIIQFIEL